MISFDGFDFYKDKTHMSHKEVLSKLNELESLRAMREEIQEILSMARDITKKKGGAAIWRSIALNEIDRVVNPNEN